MRLSVNPWTVAHQALLSMGILQERILEWVATPPSRESSQPRDQTQVDSLPSEPPGKPLQMGKEAQQGYRNLPLRESCSVLADGNSRLLSGLCVVIERYMTGQWALPYLQWPYGAIF